MVAPLEVCEDEVEEKHITLAEEVHVDRGHEVVLTRSVLQG